MNQECSILLLGAKGTAKALDLSERQIRKLNASALMPAPLRISGSVRWSYDELRAWVKAGAPARAEWEAAQRNRCT